MPLAVLEKIGKAQALTHMGNYFADCDSGRPAYSGSRFETFAGGGDQGHPHRVTSEDLVAVSMLSVHVPAQAALGIMGSLAEEVQSQLMKLPLDVHFEDLNDADFELLLGEQGPASRVWTLLRQPAARWGVGQTTASKILARKRPHLIPIYDSVVAGATGLRSSANHWTRWHTAFHGQGGQRGLDLLREIRIESGQIHLSLLRVLDIVIWMDRRGPREMVETVGDQG